MFNTLGLMVLKIFYTDFYSAKSYINLIYRQNGFYSIGDILIPCSQLSSQKDHQYFNQY